MSLKFSESTGKTLKPCADSLAHRKSFFEKIANGPRTQKGMCKVSYKFLVMVNKWNKDFKDLELIFCISFTCLCFCFVLLKFIPQIKCSQIKIISFVECNSCNMYLSDDNSNRMNYGRIPRNLEVKLNLHTTLSLLKCRIKENVFKWA